MFLTQKQIKMPLQNSQRIKHLIPINTSRVLICKYKQIILYDICEQKKIVSTFPQEWECQNNHILKNYISIIEIKYHPKLNKLYLLISRTQKQKHYNWIFLSIQISENKFVNPFIITDFQNNISKYQNMELKPSIINLNKSNYTVLLRQFYNHSNISVYEKDKELYNFFINQQNLSQFNSSNLLVSFRSIFKNKIIFELFDVQKANNSSKKNVYQVDIIKSGVIISIKQLRKCVKEKKLAANYENTIQLKMPQIQHFMAVFAINWRNKSISYLIYQSQNNTILQNIQQINTKFNTLFLDFVIISQNKSCSLQLKDNKDVLVLQNIYTDPSQNPCQEQIYQLDSQFQQFSFSNDEQDNFIIANYGQPVDRQNQINCIFYKGVKKQQIYMKFARKLDFSQGIIEDIIQLLV